MTSKQNNLFWDLDETLVHTLVASNEKHADELIDLYGEHWAGTKINIRHDGWYVTFLRKSTKRLLEFSRELLGPENVYMLSHGSNDYIAWVNVRVGLGFDPNTNLFGREDVFWLDTCPKFKDHFNVLIDNENYLYHSCGDRGKVKFLNNIPEEQFIQIPQFTVWSESITDDKIDELVEDMKTKITNAFELCQTP